MAEPGRVSRRPRRQDYVLGEGKSPSRCQDHASTQRSCSTAASGSSLSPSARSPRSRATSDPPRGAAKASAPGRGRRRQAHRPATSVRARAHQSSCEARTTSFAAPTRSSSPLSFFSPASSTKTDRSERLHRRAPRALRGRADLQDPGRLGVRLLRARQGQALCARQRRRAPARGDPQNPRRKLRGLRLPAHLEGAACAPASRASRAAPSSG